MFGIVCTCWLRNAALVNARQSSCNAADLDLRRLQAIWGPSWVALFGPFGVTSLPDCREFGGR